MHTRLSLAIGLCVFVVSGPVVHAQTAAAPAASEEIEPRTIGSAGTLLIGFSGYADRFFSRSDDAPLNYTLQIDATRFVSDRIALHGGLTGSNRLGEDEEDLLEGLGAPALHAFVGARFYFTPDSMGSVYAGAGYWVQITDRRDGDTGVVMGIAGFQGAMSSRASVFVEGGYGFGLESGDSRVARMTALIGVRLKW